MNRRSIIKSLGAASPLALLFAAKPKAAKATSLADAKIYLASLEQYEGGLEVEVVIDTIGGNPVWTPDDEGVYMLYNPGMYPEYKTFPACSGAYTPPAPTIRRSDDNTIYMHTFDRNNQYSSKTFAQMMVLILVFP